MIIQAAENLFLTKQIYCFLITNARFYHDYPWFLINLYSAIIKIIILSYNFNIHLFHSCLVENFGNHQRSAKIIKVYPLRSRQPHYSKDLLPFSLSLSLIPVPLTINIITAC